MHNCRKQLYFIKQTSHLHYNKKIQANISPKTLLPFAPAQFEVEFYLNIGWLAQTLCIWRPVQVVLKNHA